MKLKATTVRAADGAVRAAHVAVCDCGHDAFVAFQLDGQTHFHLQCAQCEVSYCPAGVCEE